MMSLLVRGREVCGIGPTLTGFAAVLVVFAFATVFVVFFAFFLAAIFLAPPWMSDERDLKKIGRNYLKIKAQTD
jgi:hypothetical protein